MRASSSSSEIASARISRSLRLLNVPTSPALPPTRRWSRPVCCPERNLCATTHRPTPPNPVPWSVYKAARSTATSSGKRSPDPRPPPDEALMDAKEQDHDDRPADPRPQGQPLRQRGRHFYLEINSRLPSRAGDGHLQ